jgi:hypothetical protein
MNDVQNRGRNEYAPCSAKQVNRNQHWTVTDFETEGMCNYMFWQLMFYKSPVVA